MPPSKSSGTYNAYLKLRSERAAQRKQNRDRARPPPTADGSPPVLSTEHVEPVGAPPPANAPAAAHHRHRRASVKARAVAAGLTVLDGDHNTPRHTTKRASIKPLKSSSPPTATAVAAPALSLSATAPVAVGLLIASSGGTTAIASPKARSGSKSPQSKEIARSKVPAFLRAVSANTEREDETPSVRGSKSPAASARGFDASGGGGAGGGTARSGGGETSLFGLFSPAKPKLTVSEVRALIDREHKRTEKVRINSKIESAIALVPDREFVSPRPRHTIDDADLQFEFHLEVDRQIRESKAKEKAKIEAQLKAKHDREEHERKQRFYLGKAAADKLAEQQREKEHSELLSKQRQLLRQPTVIITGKEEDIKTTSASGSGDGGSGGGGGGPETPKSYRRDGDPDMNGLIAVRERKILRFHPSIIAAIDRFWYTITKTPISYAIDSESCVRWKEYLDLHMKMSKALHTNFAPLRARQNALDDWRRDAEACGGQYLDRERFTDAIFEIADHWTDTLEVVDYVSFLNKLYFRLTGTRLGEDERGRLRRAKRERGLSKFRELAWRVLRHVQRRRRTGADSIWTVDDDGSTSDLPSIEDAFNRQRAAAEAADLLQIKTTSAIANLVGAFTHAPQSAWLKYADPNYDWKRDIELLKSGASGGGPQHRRSDSRRRFSVSDAPLIPHHLTIAVPSPSAASPSRRSTLPTPGSGSGGKSGAAIAALFSPPAAPQPSKHVAFSVDSMPVVNEENKAAYEQHLKELHSMNVERKEAIDKRAARRGSSSGGADQLALETPPETERHRIRRRV